MTGERILSALRVLAQGNCISDDDWRLLQRELRARTIAHAVAIGYNRGLLGAAVLTSAQGGIHDGTVSDTTDGLSAP
jgi:hypothetical protein